MLLFIIMAGEFDLGVPKPEFDLDLSDPSNFVKLELLLTMAGWMVATDHPTETSVDIRMRNMGGVSGFSAEKFIEELRLIDRDSEMVTGYSVTRDDGRLGLRFVGKPDDKFTDVAKRLYDMSDYAA